MKKKLNLLSPLLISTLFTSISCSVNTDYSKEEKIQVDKVKKIFWWK
ncbi:Uncharacterised protein [Mycoplasmopsis maculosa]|uniref:Lipoprotein n=1 Tax=Mycoplasmopsis maculosa TaxID=114885 RepID=A0A449B4G0_9BACT|nr:hypothetical protein [Mycoplasmopsis maculosa]VEU75418.1 Uncharacterised protein [Mycoplasmopsis maculosa]